MFEFNRVGYGGGSEALSLRLIAVYDTKTIGSYENTLLPPGEPLRCALYTLEGEGGLLLSDDTEIKLTAGSLIFMKHERIRSLKSSSPQWHFHCYWFAKSEIGLPYERVFDYPQSEEQSNSFAKSLIALLNSRNRYSLLEANARFSITVFSFLATLGEGKDAPQIPAKFQAIFAHINASFYTSETLEEIAKAHGYCEKQLRNLFKRYMGITPKQYILHQRVEKACQMLVFSSSSIEEIASALGFSSPYLFAHTFKRYKGISPTGYRAKMLKEGKGAPFASEDAPKKSA